MQLVHSSFFQGENVQQIARDLLGKIVLTQLNGEATACRIVETEAYAAPEDKASHAYNFRKTKRTATMYLQGGHGYIYLCYGIHHLFNVVTGPKDLPHAVLIRAGEPILNPAYMMKRRNKNRLEPSISAGPGSLSQALGITTKLDGISLLDPDSPICIMEDNFSFSTEDIMETPRVGIAYAEEFVDKPWRYFIKGSKWVSNRDGLKYAK